MKTTTIIEPKDFKPYPEVLESHAEAFGCEYNDLSFFYRMFTKIVGTTPAAYRSKATF